MRRLGAAFVVFVLLGGLLFGGGLLWAQHQASQISLSSLEGGGRSVVLAADGKHELGYIASAESGKALKDEQVSTLIKHAHMAAEDRSFYAHGAISLPGFAWAMWTNARKGALAAGGSTITQQYAKKYAGSDRTVQRKKNELIYAYRIEKDFTKDQILVRYVNANYYGRGAYGIEDAATTWFGVSATKLSNMNDPLQVARAAFLASLLKQPSVYDDYQGKPSNLTYAKVVWDRTAYVLDGLRDLKGLPSDSKGKPLMVSQAVINQAKQLLPLKLTDAFKGTGNAVSGDPYLMRYVQDWMIAWQTELALKDGLKGKEAEEEGRSVAEEMWARGGLKVQTDIDATAQARLTSAAKSRLTSPSGMIVLNPRTGGVVAMVGGRDYNADPFNYALYTSRPPGSTMKPFVLADAVSKGISVKSEFAAPAEIRIDGPPIRDHSGRDAPGCKMNLMDAMASSNNPVHIELITGKMASCQDRSKLTAIPDYPVTPASVAAFMRRAGADASLVPGREAPVKIGEEPRLGIGATLELSPLKLAVMASALATGEYHKPYVVRRIDAPSGESIFKHEDETRRVLDEKHAAIVSQVLTGVFTRGTATGAQVEGHPMAGKTGTTDEDLGDSWAFMYRAVNPKQKNEAGYVCVGWAGKNPNSAGADVAKACQFFYQGVLKGRPRVDFPSADLNAGKLVGLNTKGVPPPAPATTQASNPPGGSQPSGRPPRPTSPPPAPPTRTTTRSVPPPENGSGPPITGTVGVPGLPGG